MPPPSLESLSTVEVRPRLRGRLHAVAAVLQVGGLVWLVRSAGTTKATVAAWVYGLAAVLCYLTSSTYHLWPRFDRTREVLRRADHSMIYVLIAGSFTPICLLAMTGWWRWPLIATFWATASAGVALTVAPSTPFPRFGTALYLILGWAAASAFPALARHPGRVALALIAGLLYTVGAVLFGLQRPRLRPNFFGYHEFWHCLVVAAGAMLFAVNLGLVGSRAA